MAKKKKEVQEVQFVEINGVRIEPIEDTIVQGERKYNCKLISDNGDGTLTVEHSVFTGKGKTFLGNVKSVIYAHTAAGVARLKSDLADKAKADRLEYNSNRQTLSDDKNDFRTGETRESAPLSQLKKKLGSGTMTEEELKLAELASKTFGIDLMSLVKK